jgi:uncharacterized protein YegJ (DUF2314 family)
MVRAQRGELAPNAPRDKPTPAYDECQVRRWMRAMQPYVDSARATYAAAKTRYLSGLPPGHTFFVTVRLTDEDKRIEQVFLVVDSIRNDRVYGRIRSPIEVVRGYRYGQPYDVPESELYDWMVARPDGTEEGNFVGKFMDTYRPPPVCSIA